MTHHVFHITLLALGTKSKASCNNHFDGQRIASTISILINSNFGHRAIPYISSQRENSNALPLFL